MTSKEAWNGLLDRIKNYAEIFEDKEEQALILKQLDVIRPYLVSPTADEVCKALSEFVGREVSYTNKQFHYIIKNTQVLIYVTETYNNKTFSLGVYLPPHLITLIGRFYEGEIKWVKH